MRNNETIKTAAKLSVSSFVLICLSIICLCVSVYAWLTTTGTSKTGAFIATTTSHDIVVHDVFVVNVTTPSYNNNPNVTLREYDPYIQSNNINTNAILFIKVSVSQINKLYLRLTPKLIDEEEIGITDVCYMQMYFGNVSEDPDSNLYQTYNQMFNNTTDYPTISNFPVNGNSIGNDRLAGTFDESVTSSVWIVINIDYMQSKVATYIAPRETEYDLSIVNNVSFLNNFDCLLYGG